MSRRSRLRQEAVQVRGRIDRRAWLIRQRIDRLIHQARALVRSPAALPVAFVCGMLLERLPVFAYALRIGRRIGYIARGIPQRFLSRVAVSAFRWMQ